MSCTETVIGWDIGGAHLKAARVRGDGAVEAAVQLPCPLWQGLAHLRAALADADEHVGSAGRHAITMTGELVDLFDNRAQGVGAILDTVIEHVAGSRIEVFAGAAGFLDPAAARRRYAEVASANWRATAECVASRTGDALLVDIGSTTTDIVPLRDGAVVAQGHDDSTRLIAQELLYLGVVRTPLMALASRWRFEDSTTGICNEHFATMADVYRVTGELPERADQHPAADNGPKTREASMRRFARMIGRDVESAPVQAWRRLARWLRALHVELTAQAIAAVAQRAGLDAAAPVVAAGAGEFVARDVAARLERRCVSFAELIGNPAGLDLATCAPAVAVARLAWQA